MTKYLLYIMLLLSQQLLADAFRPAADDKFILAAPLPMTSRMAELVARHEDKPEGNITLELTSLYLQGARQPGFEDWFHEAEQLLDTLSEQHSDVLQYQLLRADIQQQQHQFQAALKTLDAVFENDPQHIYASLMAARIYLATAQHDAAQQACARLWQQDLFLMSVCSFEVAGRRGNWSTSYPALRDLFQRQASIPPAIDIWVRGILAEQAEQLGQLTDAQQWLSPVLAKAPTSLWLKWADLSLKLEDAVQVYNKLALKQQDLRIADSLLVRLVRAEQQMAILPDNAKSQRFSAELAQRVALRIARGDTDHAADLAYYFLHIELDAAAAVHWATLNYQSAKEPDDLALLIQSQRVLSQRNQLAEPQLTEAEK